MHFFRNKGIQFSLQNENIFPRPRKIQKYSIFILFRNKLWIIRKRQT